MLAGATKVQPSSLELYSSLEFYSWQFLEMVGGVYMKKNQEFDCLGVSQPSEICILCSISAAKPMETGGNLILLPAQLHYDFRTDHSFGSG